MDAAVVLGQSRQPLVEVLQPLPFALGEHRCEIRERARSRLVGVLNGTIDAAQAQLHHPLLAGSQGVLQQPARLAAVQGGVHRTGFAVHHVAMEAVLLEGCGIGLAPEPLAVGFVVGEDPAAGLLAVELIHPQVGDGIGDDGVAAGIVASWGRQADLVLDLVGIAPAPGVAQPQAGQQGQRCGVGAAVGGPDSDQQIFRSCLGVFNDDIEVATLVEDAGVDQFVFGLVASAAAVLRPQIFIGKGSLRVLVERPHEAVRGGVGEMEEIVLEVFAVVAFRVAEPEGPLLENRIDAIPQG